MSSEALALKMAQTEAYFRLHSDSILFDVLDGDGGSVVVQLPGFFDSAVKGEDARKMGSVEWHKRMPHLTIYTGNANTYIVAEETYVVVGAKQYRVREMSDDKSEGAFQTVLWLI